MVRAGASALAAVALALFSTCSSSAARHPRGRKSHAAAVVVARPGLTRRTVVLGHSVRGRRITAYELGGRHARGAVLVIGCIHGNETAGIAVARRLTRGPAITGVDAWVVPDLNPDGVAAGTRQNAHGVDLNRNFPWHWRPLGPRGAQQYAGPHSLSEPESRIAHSLILRVRPEITIWFHQPLGLVDDSGGSRRIERAFARLAGLPFRRLTRYPGSAASWQDARLAHTTAFVVELPAGAPSRDRLARYVQAVRRTAEIGGPHGQ